MNGDESYEQMATSPLEIEEKNANIKNKKQKNNLCSIFSQIPKENLIKYTIIFFLICSIIILLILLTFKTGELSNLNQKNTELQQNANFLTEEDEDLKKEKFELEKEISDIQNDKLQLNGEIYLLSQEKMQYSTKQQKNENNLEEFQKKLTSFDSQIENKINENKNLEIQLENKTEISSDIKAKIEKLKENINLIEKEINEIKLEKEKEIGINSKIINLQQIQNLNSIISSVVNNPPKKFNKIFDSETDNISATIFHSKCDNEEGTLTIIKDNIGNIIGGFTLASWKGQGFKQDTSAFLFNLSTNKIYFVNNSQKAIQANPTCLTIFGEGDLSVCENENTSEFPRAYGIGSKGYELLGKNNFKILEMEVYGFTLTK